MAVIRIWQISFEDVQPQRFGICVYGTLVKELVTTLESDQCNNIYFLEEFITNNIMKIHFMN